VATVGPPTAVTRGTRIGATALLALAPWLWFAVRDRLGWLSDVGWTVLPALAVVVMLAAVVLWRSWPLRALAASLVVMMVVAIVLPWTPADRGPVVPGSGVRVVGANVTARVDTAAGLVGLAPDVLVVTEMTGGLDGSLSAIYPHRFWERDRSDVAVYSRLPFRVTEISGPDLPGVRAEVDGPAGPFVLYALHVPRPWWNARGYQVTPPEHSRLIDVLARRVAAERLPVMVVGDLNTPDRTADFHRLLTGGGLVDAMRDGWAGPTSVGQWAPLLARIDHVLVTQGWCGDDPARPALTRSDHSAVAATVGPCAGSPRAGD
jgi:endonuclease/exonuclease/phosphatase (EEP) superfamily protein YafD